MITRPTMQYSGFKFVEIGEFFLSDAPLDVTYRGQQDRITIELRLHKDEYKYASENVYIVSMNGEAVYVGEYSGTLAKRWLRRGKYIWHNKDVNVADAIRAGKDVRLHLLKDPFGHHSSGIAINVAKAIEHHILQSNPPAWNVRNKKATVRRAKNRSSTESGITIRSSGQP